MQTNASISIFDENNAHLVTLFKKFDGGFDCLGLELTNFLSEFAILPQWQVRLPLKSAQGMGDLAAQLIKQFKVGCGANFCITQQLTQAFHYDIRFIPASTWGGMGRVSLSGRRTNMGVVKQFKLYTVDTAPIILRRIQFVYDKRDGEPATWRTVEVTFENDKYIEGFQDGQFKRFLRNRILGGKILPA